MKLELQACFHSIGPSCYGKTNDAARSSILCVFNIVNHRMCLTPEVVHDYPSILATDVETWQDVPSCRQLRVSARLCTEPSS